MVLENSNNTVMKHLVAALTIVLSMLGTPWLFLVSTSIPLYLLNQEDLSYHVPVLYPFVFAAVAIAVFMAVLFLLSQRIVWLQWLRKLIWLYYIVGGLFLILSLLRSMDFLSLNIKLVLTLLLIASSFALAYVLGRVVPLTKAAVPLAVVSTAFACIDLSQLARGMEAYIPPHAAHNKPSVIVDPAIIERKDLPNIYHIVLDEYQTGMFLRTLDLETQAQLGGFHFFPETTTLFGRTGMSMPSIFSGQPYNFVSPQREYQHEAFNSEKSFLCWLQKSGYQTAAYLHKLYDFEQTLFEYVNYHNSFQTMRHTGHAAMFFNLWVYSNVPAPAAKKLVNTEYLEQQKKQNTLSPNKPIQSLEILNTLIELEGKQADTGRYLFMHLLLPHFPYVLNPDCSYKPDLSETSPLSQSRCATQLALSFLKELRKLGRLDDSIVIIQSDHGARFKVESGFSGFLSDRKQYSPYWEGARSRALLLIKPPMPGADFETSFFPSSLIDIAPTLIQLLGINAPQFKHGVNLLDPKASNSMRERFYHFFEKKGPNEWTDEMARYRIDGERFYSEGTITLKNNLRPTE